MPTDPRRVHIRRPARTDAEVDDELRLHVELRIEQLVARGVPRPAAEAEARRRFGASWPDAVASLHEAGRHREAHIALRERLSGWRDDLRFAVRSLRRAPRYTAATLLSLAIGLGATTAVFSVVDHVVLRALPFADPARLVSVREVVHAVREAYPTLPANASHVLAWRRECTECEEVAFLRRRYLVMSGDGDPQRVGAARVSANLLPMLGVRPASGRGFHADEESEGGPRVVLLSDAFWRRQFGGDPGVVGRTIRVADVSWEVVGIMPPGFSLPDLETLGTSAETPRRVDLFLPMRLSERERTTPGEFDYTVMVRMRPGVSVEAVQRRIDGIQAELAKRSPPGIGGLNAVVTPLHEQVVGGVRRPLFLMLAAVGTMLLIVGANLANLTLARDLGRRRESALRAALGAGRARLARLALVESVLLATVGGALGMLLALAGVRLLVAWAPATLPRLDRVSVDARVFLVALVITALVGIGVGLWPALRVARTAPGAALRDAGRGASGGRGSARRRAAFIGAQVALSAMMLVVTGLLLASFVRVLRIERGFHAPETLAMDIAIPWARYRTPAARLAFLEQSRRELAAIPGVSGVAMTNGVPLEGDNQVDRVLVAGDAQSGGDGLTANIRYVNPGYFATVGTPVVRGRPFDDGDRGRRVVVISERTARTLFPAGDAIGRLIVPGSNDSIAEVIGVAADVRMASLEQEGSLAVYVPWWSPTSYTSTILLRATRDAPSLAAPARTTLRRIEPALVPGTTRTLDDVVRDALAPRRFQLALLGLLAILALVTASIGIYGVIAHSLSLRTRELATRMALGASPAMVRRMVVVEGMRPVLLGLATGLVASIAIGRVVAGLLFEVQPSDPLTLVGVALVLGGVAIVACVVPARRAARGELVGMLRTE